MAFICPRKWTFIKDVSISIHYLRSLKFMFVINMEKNIESTYKTTYNLLDYVDSVNQSFDGNKSSILSNQSQESLGTYDSDESLDKNINEMEIEHDWEIVKSKKLKKRIFKGISGPNLPEDLKITPLSLFKLFFTDQLIDEMVNQTNMYALQCKKSKEIHLKKYPSARLNYWKDLNRDDIFVFIGLIIIMGIHKNTEYSDNWSKDPLLSTKFSKYMPRNKFQLLQRYLHLDNNDDNENLGRLKKVKNFTNYLQEKWRFYYQPNQNICIDEAMIAFKGRLLFKQYNPLKPTKWGIKVFLLSESCSGYTFNAIIYEGKQIEGENKSVAFSVVKKLVSGYENKNHHLFTDRYYTSIPIIKELEKMQISFTGTINGNRAGLPKIPKLEKNDKIYYYKDNMIYLVWNPKKKPVSLITNHQSINRHIYEYINKKTNSKLVIEKPEVVHLYNKNAKGVDLMNNYCSTYKFDHKNYRWWKSVFYFYIDVTITNCFIIMNRFTKISLKEFRIQLSRDLLDSGNKIPSSTKSKNNKHLPDYIRRPNASDPRLKCIICKKKTKFLCTKCTYDNAEFFALCNPGCFIEHHL